MMRQQVLNFNAKVEKVINQFHEAPRTESKTEGRTVKLTATQKMALDSLANDSGIGTSTFISEAIDFYLHWLPYNKKLERYEATISALLSSME